MRIIALLVITAVLGLSQEAARYYYSGTDLIYTCTAESDQGTSTVSVTGGDLTSIVVSSNTGTVTTADLGIPPGASITVTAAQTTWSIDSSTLTDIVVSTNTGTATTASAHGLAVAEIITISGATVDGDLNGAYAIASTPTSTTFTITTSSVGDATYTETGLQFVNSDSDLAATYTVATSTSSTAFTITTSSVADGTYILGVSFTTTVPLNSAAIWRIKRFSYDGSSNLIYQAWAGGTVTKSRVCADRATLTYR